VIWAKLSNGFERLHTGSQGDCDQGEDSGQGEAGAVARTRVRDRGEDRGAGKRNGVPRRNLRGQEIREADIPYPSQTAKSKTLNRPGETPPRS
jgi:hypothetical protein